MEIFLFFTMVFMHIVADYNLQGILANMKCRAWWEEHHPEKMYKEDYAVALLIHGFAWSFCIMLPLAVYSGFHVGHGFAYALIINTLIHGYVDSLKANHHLLSLTDDQLIHIAQIAFTFGLRGMLY